MYVAWKDAYRLSRMILLMSRESSLKFPTVWAQERRIVDPGDCDYVESGSGL